MIHTSEVREARSLDRLLGSLVQEYDDEETPFAIRATGRALAFAFVWLLPAAAPLLAWRGELGLALVATVVGIFFPAAYRSNHRIDRDEDLRLHGPRGEAVWLARLIEQLPWLAWAALAAGAVPLAHARHHGAGFTDVALYAAALSAAFPFIRLSTGEGGRRMGTVRRLIESVSPLLFGVTLVLLYSRWDPATTAPLDQELRVGLRLALVATAVALASRAARRLTPAATWGLDEGEDASDRSTQPVDMGIPATHAPARSALAAELRLARLDLEFRLGAARHFGTRLLVALRALVSLVFPAAAGVACVALLGDEAPGASPAGEPVVSLLGLWIGGLFLGGSRPLRSDDWLRGMDWRTQLGLGRLRWWMLSMAPLAIGCAWAVRRADGSEQSLALAALVLAGGALRGHHSGLDWLVPGATDGRRWARGLATLVGVATGLVLIGLPVAHVLDLDVSPRVGLLVAGGVAGLALVGAGSDLFLRDEDSLAREFAARHDEPDDEEDDLR